MPNDIVQYSVSDIRLIGEVIAKSSLFGVKTPDQAIALCMVAHAEGRHPALAARDYDIIQGKPAKKSEAMLRDFLQSNGKVTWHESTDKVADATFSHPNGGEIRITWDMERAAVAGLHQKDNWRKWPRQMLRARVVSEGVRAVCPMATSGMYVPEEIVDFDQPKSAMAQWAETPPPTIEHEEKDNKLEQAAAEFERRLNACTSLIVLNNMVANNNALLLKLKTDLPDKYNYLCAEISKHQEAFEMAKLDDAAE